jgi:hypothetical protein
MQRTENELIHMFRQVRDCGIKHKAEISQHIDLMHDFEEFDHLLVRIEALLLHIDRINAMATIDPLELGEQMVEKAIMLSSAICVWAINADEREIQNRVNQLRSDLFKTQDDSIAFTSAEILTEAQALGKPLIDYGISKLDFKQLAIYVEAYRACIDKPDSIGNMGDMLKAAADWLEEHLDQSVRDVAEGEPELYKQFRLVRTKFGMSGTHAA